VGFRYYVDLHVVVRGDLTVRRGHEIAHSVESIGSSCSTSRLRGVSAYRAGRRIALQTKKIELPAFEAP
jgi:hypothetical protein